MSTCPEKRPLLPLALLFLRIGIMGFGGALANMALMEQACVKRHKWLTQAHYLEGVALSYLLPGPTAVLLSIYLGSRRRGLVGGVVSGLSFIAPAVVLTFVLSWVYFQYHRIPAVAALFAGLGPVVVALILAMLYRTGRTALTSLSRAGLGLAGGVLLVFPVLPQAWNLITLLLLSGLVGMLFFHERATTVGSTGVIAVAGMGVFMREAALSLSPELVVLLPPFIFMLGVTPLLMRLRHSALVQGILQGNLVGALGMMGATALLLGRAAITNPWQVLLALVSLVLLIWWKVPPVYVILAVAALGLLRLLFSLP